MKVYQSIEELGEGVGISERTAWRWLRQGKVKKKRSEDGRIIFVLVDKPTDITDTDVTDNGTTDVSSDMSVGDTKVVKKPVTTDRGKGEKRMSVENRVDKTSVTLDCLKALRRLKDVADDTVTSYRGTEALRLRDMNPENEIAQKHYRAWQGMQRALGEADQIFSEGEFDEATLKNMWGSFLKTRSQWERESAAMIRESELGGESDPETQAEVREFKTNLKAELKMFDELLEGVKGLLIMQVEA